MDNTLKYGENGDLLNKSTNNLFIDLFNKLVRDAKDNDINTIINNIIDLNPTTDDVVDLFILCFETRDIRGGKGERMLFYNFYLQLYKYYPELCIILLKYIKDYGYFKDFINIYELSNNKLLKKEIINIFSSTLVEDSIKVNNISLCSKYTPRENKNHYEFFIHLRNKLFKTSKNKNLDYRKFIVSISKKLNITETFMCSKNFKSIDFRTVPSICLHKNKYAFLNVLSSFPDEERSSDIDRIECRNNFKQNKKINAKILYPYQLIQELYQMDTITKELSDLYDIQWNEIKLNIINKNILFNLVCLSDVSASMSGIPMYVSISMGILISELSSSKAFQTGFISFSNKPEWINLTTETTLFDKVQKAKNSKWGGSTNFYDAMLLILNIANCFNLSSSEIPDLIVFSDMQFNEADSNYTETMHTKLIKVFKTKKYKLPKIIYWNLRGNTSGVVVKEHTTNTQLLSGFSPSLLNSIINNEDITKITPYYTLRKTLDDDRYNSLKNEILEYFDSYDIYETL